MKKITYLLSAIAIAISMGSCSSDQELDSVQTKKNEIGFRTFIDKGNNTRATVTNGENILGFTVTGWWDKAGTWGNDTESESINEPSTGAASEYLFNAYDITRRDVAIADWSYSPLRYWPGADVIGGGVKFYAYSPASSKNVLTGLANYAGDEIVYKVPDPSKTEAQEDFLLARTKPLRSDQVTLNFLHALSRVKFSARTTNTNLTYVIGGVELINIHKEGKIKMTDIPNDESSPEFNYSNGRLTLWETADIITPYDGSTENTTESCVGLDLGESPINLLGDNAKEYYSLHGETGALMVLPQKTNLGNYDKVTGEPDVDTGFWIMVRYKAYLNNPDGTYFVGSKDAYEKRYFQVLDPASTGSAKIPFTFEIGRPYVFRLEFGSEAGDDIKFDVEVGDWNDAGSVNL